MDHLRKPLEELIVVTQKNLQQMGFSLSQMNPMAATQLNTTGILINIVGDMSDMILELINRVKVLEGSTDDPVESPVHRP